MKYLLGRAMVVQETCEKKKKLLDSCQVYSELSPLDQVSTDLYIDNNLYVIMGDT